MRLVVITHKSCWSCDCSPTGYATDGGFPRQMEALSELFDETVLLLPCEGVGTRPGQMPLRGRGLSVHPLSPLGQGSLRRKLLHPWWLLRNLPTLVRQMSRGDAVHALIPGDVGTSGMVLALALGRPLLVRHCGNWLVQQTCSERFGRWFMERVAGGKNVMLATGGQEQPPSPKNPAVRWIFSSSLHDDELRAHARLGAKTLQDPIRLIIVARQEPAKGTDVVIGALPEILRHHALVELHVVGDGSYLPRLKSQANALGLAGQIVFYGKVDHQRVIQLLQQAHLFCFPTTSSEGFPKGVLEALSCGLPAITTAVSVLPQLIGQGCGILLPQAEPAALARAVCELIDNPSRYRQMSERAIAIATKYSLEGWRDTIGAWLREAWGPTCASEGSHTARLPLSGAAKTGSAAAALSPMTKGNVKPMREGSDAEQTMPPKIQHPDVGSYISLYSPPTPTGEFPSRITFVAGTLGQGGAERQLYYMLKALQNQGVACRVLSLTKGEFWEHRIRTDLQVPIIWVGSSPWRWQRLLRIIGELKRERPDVIQSAHFFTNLYAVVAARILGLREIGAIRNDVTSEVGNSWLGRLGLTTPRLLAANSRAGIKTAADWGLPAGRCLFLPNVVDTVRFSPSVRTSSPYLRILGVGRLVPQKRFDRFLNVIAAVRRQRGDTVRATIVGAGPEQSRLEQLTEELDLKGTVVFAGSVDDISAQYAQADLLLLTSDWEGTPNVVLEAMASGLPVAATPVGGIAEVIEDGVNGFLGPDEAALSAAVLRLGSEEKIRQTVGSEARAHVERCHSLHSLPQSLLVLYRTLLR